MAELPRTTAASLYRMWQDSASPAAVWPNGVTAPALVNMTSANIQAMAYALNDLLYFQLQMPHGTAPSSDARLHVHFTFPTQPTSGRWVKWEVYYSVGDINAAFGAESAVQTVEYQVQATDALYHRVASICTITLPATPQSSAIIGRLKRISATSGTETDVNPVVLFLDAHIQLDSPGTFGEFA